jgi:hypothetical protein
VGQSKHLSIDIALETSLKNPAGQNVQDAWPVDGLNVPAGHEVQAAKEVLPVDGL